MNQTRSLLFVGTTLLLFFGCTSPVGPPADGPQKKLLYLTLSAGFKHSVLPFSEKKMQELGAQSGYFSVEVTQDAGRINAENLQQFSAVVFYTTGELPMSEAQKQALLDFVRSGNAFIGVHSATDTFYEWAEYGRMIGGYFDQHPWHQDVTIRVEDTRHPATRHLGESFPIKDEIYQFKNFSRENVRVLMSLDTASVDLTKPAVHRTDGDFALAWCRQYGQGRVFYTALGHREEVWQDERFQTHLVSGIRWAMGELAGDATPRPKPRALPHHPINNY